MSFKIINSKINSKIINKNNVGQSLDDGSTLMDAFVVESLDVSVDL